MNAVSARKKRTASQEPVISKSCRVTLHNLRAPYWDQSQHLGQTEASSPGREHVALSTRHGFVHHRGPSCQSRSPHKSSNNSSDPTQIVETASAASQSRAQQDTTGDVRLTTFPRQRKQQTKEGNTYKRPMSSADPSKMEPPTSYVYKRQVLAGFFLKIALNFFIKWFRNNNWRGLWCSSSDKGNISRQELIATLPYVPPNAITRLIYAQILNSDRELLVRRVQQ